MTKINIYFIIIIIFFCLWMTNIIYPNIPISLINSFNGRVYFLERIFFFFLTILTYIFLCTYALNAIKVIELYM